jgi:Raf kinase inhibitor-like YbhB/YbcL family protein
MQRKRKLFIGGSIFLVIIFFGIVAMQRAFNTAQESAKNISYTTNMLLTSPSFENNAAIPKKYTCDGGDINPELLIQNVPDDAKSLALILDDPDAPNGIFTHWVVWNIDPRTMSIKQESVPPKSSEGKNSAGRVGYIGPCPPSGVHHYHFKMYALDAMLALPEGASKAELEKSMQGHILEETDFVGTYSRE